jgi:hypothetical protein
LLDGRTRSRAGRTRRLPVVARKLHEKDPQN